MKNLSLKKKNDTKKSLNFSLNEFNPKYILKEALTLETRFLIAIEASSIVEAINSILRTYLDRSKNQVTQEFLNLFAFYHNHRVYNDRKRKGKTPMEILTNQKQDKDWIELLMDTIEEKEPLFFL